MRISEVPCEGERPVDAPFIKGTTINRNPYDDMFAQDTTRREVEDEVWQSRKRKAESTTRGKKARKAVKDRSKLGFDDEDAQDRPTDAVSTFVKSAKIISAHDILEDSDLAKQSVYTDEQKKQIKRERDEFERKNGMKGDSRTERIKNKINKREARYADLGDEDDDAYDAMDAPPLRQLSAAEIEQSEARKAAAKAEQDSLIAELRKNRPSDSSAAGGPEKKKTAGSAYLDEQRAKFAKRKSGIDREKESFLKMESWRRTLKKEKRKEAAPTQEDAEAADAVCVMRFCVLSLSLFWFGVNPQVPRYTVHERALYFNSSFDKLLECSCLGLCCHSCANLHFFRKVFDDAERLCHIVGRGVRAVSPSTCFPSLSSYDH